MKIVNSHLVAEANESIEFVPSPNFSLPIQPTYLVIHFTAGPTTEGTVSWFRNKASNVSAHLVIGRDGKVTQMVPFDKKAWHAGVSQWGSIQGLNQHSIGIELVNGGKLSLNGKKQWVTWSLKVIPDEEVTVAEHKNEHTATGWHEYTEEQLESLISVASVLHEEFKFSDILGHEDIAPTRKVDPGPLFPMNSFKSKILGRA